MKPNVFNKPDEAQGFTLSHSAQTEIIASAKTKSVGTLQGALKLFAEQNSDTLKHGIDWIEEEKYYNRMSLSGELTAYKRVHRDNGDRHAGRPAVGKRIPARHLWRKVCRTGAAGACQGGRD